MASGTLLPAPWFTALDGNGHPLSGAKAFFYVAGTTTLQATYSDVGLTTPNTNPVIADSAGRIGPVYLTPGASYKLVLQDSTGASVRSQDNIAAVPPTSINVDISGTAGEALTAGQAVYLSDGSGSKTAGSWYKADSGNPYSSSLPQVGMVPSAIAAGAVGTIRLSGQVTGLTSLTVGTTYYVGSSGAMTATVPTNRRGLGVADTTGSLVLSADPPLPNDWTTVTVTTTGTQNDWAPGLLAHTIIRCNNATLLTIQGLAGGYDGQRLLILSVGAGQVDLAPQNASSVAANRLLNFATVGNTSLAAGSGTAEYVYDATAARWRLTEHDQGAWITRTFAAGNYTASTGTWAVASATRDAFWLKGRTLIYSFNVAGTTSGTPTTVKIALPNSYIAAAADSNTVYYTNNGSASAEIGWSQSAAATNPLAMARVANAAFGAGTVGVLGQVSLEVQ